MASSLIPDPLRLWREAVTKLESEVNSLATGGLKSQEVARALHQFSAVSMGMQQMFEKVIDSHLRRANLPSRREVSELSESLRRIEDKLDRLLPAEAVGPAVPRPARTRRPPQTAPMQAPAPAAAQPAAKPRRRAARRKEG